MRAIGAAFRQELKLMANTAMSLAWLMIAVAPVATAAWIAKANDNPAVLTYIAVGAFLYAIWNGTVFRVGWSLVGEMSQGTLEFQFVSRTSPAAVMLGKAVAIAAGGIASGLIASATVIAVGQKTPEIANFVLLFVSLGFALVAMISLSFIFAPFTLLARGRGGFFGPIQPFGALFSGFLYPVSLLPEGFEIAARFLPTAWAMEAVIRSVEDGDLSWRMVGEWGMAMLLTVVALALSYFLFRTVEQRIRINGALGTN